MYLNGLHIDAIYKPTVALWSGILSVSYTHLDVYKRQGRLFRVRVFSLYCVHFIVVCIILQFICGFISVTELVHLCQIFVR